MNQSISIIGGDLRQAILADMLEKNGFDTMIFGFDKSNDIENIKTADSLAQAADRAVIILPLPVSYDNITINAPLSNEEIKIKDIINNMPKDSILLGGKISEYIQGELDAHTICYSDYFNREELTVKNAVPTAEGAIELALSEMPITLHDSKVLILGYGRIGKVLAKILDGFNANVSICARKYDALAWIHTMGHRALPLYSLSDNISEYDVIFNTIPSMVLDKQILRNINKKTLIIDLASKPGGVGARIG